MHPETFEERPPGESGEIWICSPSVAKGYWNKPELSEETFRATIRPPAGAADADDGGAPPRHYLRTGDEGFIEVRSR